MRYTLTNTFLALTLALSPLAVSLAGDFDGINFKHGDYPAWFSKNPFIDLQEDLKKARSKSLNGLMVLFTSDGCTYCGAFVKQSLEDPKIAKVVQENFVSVGLDIFDDADMTHPRGKAMSVKTFAKQEGAGFSPTLLFFDNDGTRVLRVVGYQSPQRFTAILDYVNGKRYRTETLAEYFAALSKQAPKRDSAAGLRNDLLFSKPPYALDRSRVAAKQPLLVLFEEPGCSECDDFHTSVLALQEVRSLLERFDVVQIDATDTKTPVVMPDGRQTTPASWYKQASLTRVPTLLFFDEQGNEVLRTDALVRRQRMLNSLGYVLERAYKKGWTYQRFARSKGIERNQKANAEKP